MMIHIVKLKHHFFKASSSLSKISDTENDHYENVILNEELKNNRFHAGFILHLGTVTHYSIHVGLSFEDNNGQRWTNLTENTICIKLNNRRQSLSTVAARSSLQQIRSTGATN
ncbi:unnamed protein product [Rotaria sp. Silwood2]|nr:unnamed protein product [Rotaria sp. Silwood2]CAF2979682.1 unnamed protein product [Rotaria sp. Silwood2]CAF3095990.1 unnamed protein product [Rotaria sp. Silwood2]CAF3225941.1 unnamed protein product [Rotaria sp. Silwood2]CAF4070848.1 unnamed protein product [Rotaria sp. Silwood2]